MALSLFLRDSTPSSYNIFCGKKDGKLREAEDEVSMICDMRAATGTMDLFQVLPSELVLAILSHLAAKDVVSFMMTSRGGYRFANDLVLWKSLLRRDFKISFLDECEKEFDNLALRNVHRKACPKLANLNPDASNLWMQRYFYFYCCQFSLQLSYIRMDEDSVSHESAQLGCVHYARGCKLLASCCGMFYVCRHCHDEHFAQDHKINRHDTRLVLCMECMSVQPAGQHCRSKQCNGKSMGHYFCDRCKFYDNDKAKEIFHCRFCNACKLGKQEDAFHCDRCGRCYSVSIRNTHSCNLFNRQPRQDNSPPTASSAM